MNQNHIPIKLGPLALLLTVISICLTTLAILTFTTSMADVSLAEKYADTVTERYLIEKDGQAFIRDYQEALDEGTVSLSFPDLIADASGISWVTLERGETKLRIGLKEDGIYDFKIIGWRIYKEWEEDESIGNLWLGD